MKQQNVSQSTEPVSPRQQGVHNCSARVDKSVTLIHDKMSNHRSLSTVASRTTPKTLANPVSGNSQFKPRVDREREFLSSLPLVETVVPSPRIQCQAEEKETEESWSHVYEGSEENDSLDYVVAGLSKKIEGKTINKVMLVKPGSKFETPKGWDLDCFIHRDETAVKFRGKIGYLPFFGNTKFTKEETEKNFSQYLKQAKVLFANNPVPNADNQVIQRKDNFTSDSVIGSHSIKYEREADDIAAKVVDHSNHVALGYRKKNEIQRNKKNNLNSVNIVPPGLPSNIRKTLFSGGSRKIDTSTRENMESQFGGRDFSQVRIHTNNNAAESARSIGAKAYTVGNNIVFSKGSYSPESKDGQRLLAHELTHVIQQTGISGGVPSLQCKYQGVSAISLSGETAHHEISEIQEDASVLADSFLRRFPNLNKSVAARIRKIILQVYEYKKNIKAIDKRLSKIVDTIPGGEAYESQYELEIIRLRNRKQGLQSLIERSSQIEVDTAQILDSKSFGNEVTAKGEEDIKVEQGYKRILWATLVSKPTTLRLINKETFELLPEGIQMEWGPNKWRLSHKAGLVTFEDVLKLESFNLEYQKVLLVEMRDIIGKQAELVARLGIVYNDPEVINMNNLNKVSTALLLSLSHLGEGIEEGAKRVFGETPLQVAANIGSIIGIIIALKIVAALVPGGALIAAGVGAVLVAYFGIETVVKTVKAFLNLYNNAVAARNYDELNAAGRQFAIDGAEAAIMILIFIITGKIAKGLARKGGAGRGRAGSSTGRAKMGEVPEVEPPEIKTRKGRPRSRPSPRPEQAAWELVIEGQNKSMSFEKWIIQSENAVIDKRISLGGEVRLPPVPGGRARGPTAKIPVRARSKRDLRLNWGRIRVVLKDGAIYMDKFIRSTKTRHNEEIGITELINSGIDWARVRAVWVYTERSTCAVCARLLLELEALLPKSAVVEVADTYGVVEWVQ